MSSHENPPPEAPPTYSQATGDGASRPKPSSLEVPIIPVASRRSMEDEGRKLPEGWIRQFDVKENHQFYVNTKSDPPRSIWHHPYDDDEFLASIPSEERERIQAEEDERRRPITPSSVDEKKPKKAEESYPPLPARPDGRSSVDQGRKLGFGEKLKNKVTGMTHEERERDRARRAEEERQYYEAHMKYRQAMQKAAVTGQPQLLGKDASGKDVYITPPTYGGYGGDYGGGYGGGYGVNPYGPAGPYSMPNARYIRPQAPYGRPGYGGYGGAGLGLPIGAGLLGGALLGGLLF